MSQGIEANRGDIILMVGTRKGAFLATSDQARRNWAVSGPHHAGSDIFHMAYDDREDGTFFVGINYPVWGRRSSGATTSARLGVIPIRYD